MLIMSMGISGCGKTTYGEKLKDKISNLKIICPDDVRKMFGDISDQSRNADVFKIINEQLRSSLSRGDNIYYSATNLGKKDWERMASLCKEYNTDLIVVVFLTSFRADICMERVRSDLDCGVVRSNTLVRADGKTVIESQAERFRNAMRNIDSYKETLEGVNYRIKFLECEAR